MVISIQRLKDISANAAICALVLVPDMYARFRLNQGFSPDIVVYLTFFWLLVAASTSSVLFRFSAVSLLILNVIYLHIAKTWGPFGLSDRVEAMLESPTGESIEYLRTYLTLGDVKILSYAIVTGLLIFKNNATGTGPYKLLAALLATFLVISTFLASQPNFIVHSFSAIPIAIADASVRVARYGDRETLLAQRKRTPLVCTEHYQNVLIVLGESVNRRYMGIYGYPFNNTPFMSALKPLVFEAISPANLTRLSIPMMLTKAKVADFDRLFIEPSIVSELEDCGYRTYWISNQSGLGRNNRSSSSIGSEAEYSVFYDSPSRESSGRSQDDEWLVAEVRRALRGESHQKAIFVHLMGSHFEYSGRYPEKFRGKRAENFTEEYVTSIQYTDYVLSKLYELFSKRSLLLVYASDHGEAVGEAFTVNGLTLHGHGLSPPLKDEYEIPLVVWSSRPARAQSVFQASRGRTINTESFDGLVRYLVGMSDGADISYSDLTLAGSEDKAVEYSSLDKLQ